MGFLVGKAVEGFGDFARVGFAVVILVGFGVGTITNGLIVGFRVGYSVGYSVERDIDAGTSFMQSSNATNESRNLLAILKDFDQNKTKVPIKFN